MATRSLYLLAVLLAGLALSPGTADAQKRCVKGVPCGNTCIAANKTCRVGTGSATKAPSSQAAPASKAAPTIPDSAQYVASSRGQVYYWIGCSGWRSLAAANLVFFKTVEEAKEAGYRPSAQKGCAGPPGESKAQGSGGG